MTEIKTTEEFLDGITPKEGTSSLVGWTTVAVDGTEFLDRDGDSQSSLVNMWQNVWPTKKEADDHLDVCFQNSPESRKKWRSIPVGIMVSFGS